MGHVGIKVSEKKWESLQENEGDEGHASMFARMELFRRCQNEVAGFSGNLAAPHPLLGSPLLGLVLGLGLG